MHCLFSVRPVLLLAHLYPPPHKVSRGLHLSLQGGIKMLISAHLLKSNNLMVSLTERI